MAKLLLFDYAKFHFNFLCHRIMPFVIEWVEQSSGVERVSSIKTAVGEMLVYFRDDVICAIDWAVRHVPEDLIASVGLTDELTKWIAQYCWNPGQLFPIKLLKQGSPYRRNVWDELCAIPFGNTVSYSGIAARINSSARAVGNACRDNPFPFLIPCHRVVAVSGAGGYCGQTQGDLMSIKTRLLAFEARFKDAV